MRYLLILLTCITLAGCVEREPAKVLQLSVTPVSDTTLIISDDDTVKVISDIETRKSKDTVIVKEPVIVYPPKSTHPKEPSREPGILSPVPRFG